MPTPATRRIQLALPWTDPRNGTRHDADSVVETDPDTARDLIFAGLARVPDAPSADEPPTGNPPADRAPAKPSATDTQTKKG